MTSGPWGEKTGTHSQAEKLVEQMLQKVEKISSATAKLPP